MKNEMQQLYETIVSRKSDAQEGSYTAYLFEKGNEKILKKVGEDYAYKNAADTKVMWNEEGAMLEQLIKDLGYYMQNKRK